MGKKLRYNDLKSVASEPTVDEPVLSELDLLLQAKSEDFAADSDYDAGLTYGMNQERNRAFNQPWYDQLANAVVKTVPSIGLGILENAGYLAELTADDQNYNNIFTELAKKGRQGLEEALPAYREDPNAVFDLGDSAWWINHGQGLVESIGEFLVTGAGVGGALGKGAKALTKALPTKLAETGSKALSGAAQLTTASALAYTEGAMSGAQVYDRVLKETGNIELAAKSAAETVRINTLLNTGLNITALGPLFRTNNQLGASIRSGLNREAKETTADYIKRLTLLESQGVASAPMLKRLGLEALQEGVEEDVNLFAEQEGLITGGLKKAKGTGIDRFLDVATTQEGALSFILGAVGGVAQTAGMEYLPLQTIQGPEGTSRVSARNKELIENTEYQKATVNAFKKDIETIQELQNVLNTAVKNNDKEGIATAKEALFNVGILRSLRNETADELSKEVASVASVDNTIIGEDGMTDAMRQGLADNIDDNEYKTLAAKKAADIKSLNKEYRNLIASTGKPLVASELFRERLNVYRYESAAEQFKKEEGEIYTTLAKLIPDVSTLDITKLQAEVDAYNLIQDFYEKQGNPKVELVKSERRISDFMLKEAIQTTGKQPDTRLSKELAENLATQLNIKYKLNDAKSRYADFLANPDKFEREVKKQQDEILRKREEEARLKEEAEAKAKRDADFAAAQQEAEEKKRQAERARVETLLNQIDTAETEKDLDALLQEADTNGFTTPEIVDRIAQRRESLKTPPQDTTTQDTEEDLDPKEDEDFNSVPPWDEAQDIDIPAGPTQLNSINNVTDITTQATNEQANKELATISGNLQDADKLNPKIYGDYNKISYLAQEYDSKSKKTVDPFTINELYKVLHTDTINEGTVVTLRLAKETEWYEPNKNDAAKVPIGVYYDGKLVGYLPVYKGQSNALIQARNYIFDKGEATDVISYKTPGTLNVGERNRVEDNFALTPKFLIGRNGQFEYNLDNAYKGELINNKTPISGITYALLPTPVGKEIALPVDITYVSQQHIESFLRVLDLYFKERNLTEQERLLIDQIQQEYEFDPTTFKGLKYYFDLFFHSTNLDINTPEGKLTVELIEKETDRTNHYVQVTGKGIRFIESSGVLQEFTKADLGNTAKRERLVNHLSKTFYRSDLTKINNTREFKAPIINSDLTYSRYSKSNYNEHLASVTRTNVVTVEVKKGIQTGLVQPSLYLGFTFMNKQSKEITSFTTEDGKKFVSLEQPKQPAVLSKLTLDDYSEEEFTIDTNKPSQEDIDEVKDKCD